MALEKLIIQPLDYNGSPKGEALKVLFNPSEYSIEKSNRLQAAAIPGLSAPVTQFVGGNGQTLTMDLFFDTYEQGEDVRTHTGKITGLLDIDRDLHAPPVCKVVWGKLSFQAVMEKVSQRFTMFLDSGIPVRATLNITFREYKTLTEQQQSSSSPTNQTKQLTVKKGDTLWMIAEREYGDPGKWREIAKANKIDNPRLMQAGTQITVPPTEG